MAIFHALVLTVLIALPAFAESQSAKIKLKQLDQQSQDENWTFDYGYHPLMESSVKKITGLKIPKGWRKKATFLTTAPLRALPNRFDWRTEANGLPEIKDQGDCGSCWAFGTVGAFESIIQIRDNRRVRLSEQELVSCNRNQDNDGCQGGYFSHGFHVNPGAALESDFPYRAADVSCKAGLKHSEKLQDWAFVGGSDQRKPTVEQIKTAIYEHGPVAVVVRAGYNAFLSYKSGIFNSCQNTQSDHLVILVGWDDNGGYWILRNSWGTGWGDKGYMNIKYNCSNVGEIATFVNYKTACQPQPNAYVGDDVTITNGDWTTVGALPVIGQSYQWTPSNSLDDATSSMPIAAPSKTTTYTLKVTNACGSAEKKVTVNVN